MIVFFLLDGIPLDAYAGTPLSLALKLTDDHMKSGDTMKVSVALQNYDENYTDNDITTIIIEVSVDTEKLSIDKKSIKVDLDKGSGMGFSMGALKDNNNVELQYLNVADPLEKGTEDLYSFEITANQDIENLLDAIQITYVAMQDGTKAQSEVLTVVPVAMINGKAVEQGQVDEKYTSEYGTVSEINTENKDNPATGATADSENQTDISNENIFESQQETTFSEKSENYNETQDESSDKVKDNNSDGSYENQTNSDNMDMKDNKENKDNKNHQGQIVVLIVVLVASVIGIIVYKRRKAS